MQYEVLDEGGPPLAEAIPSQVIHAFSRFALRFALRLNLTCTIWVFVILLLFLMSYQLRGVDPRCVDVPQLKTCPGEMGHMSEQVGCLKEARRLEKKRGTPRVNSLGQAHHLRHPKPAEMARDCRTVRDVGQHRQ
ncbi:hypothetical protein BJ170DRAFT_600227 [Xylariales sp. AK1849]|nr:hypothetical protein BJ170DRAFT_600227 [Xylariales sp. AK1849]